MNPIVGIGELLWDVFPDGRKVAGGAPFNFAYHCHQLGHQAVIVSRVGDDDLGRELRDEVRRLGLSDEYIQTDYEHPTGTVRVTVDAAGQPSYTITENVAWDYIEWTPAVQRAVGAIRAVCFGTLALRMPESLSTITRFVDESHGSQHPPLLVFDVNLRQREIDYGLVLVGGPVVDWVKVNNEELERIASLDWPASFRLIPVAKRLAGRGQILLVTRGPKGCELIDDDVMVTEPAPPARVVDTVGAGDAFTAAMVCMHLEGRPLRDCARFANHYAARVCEHRGATPRIDRAEIERAAFGASGDAP
jgi:fructokinase